MRLRLQHNMGSKKLELSGGFIVNASPSAVAFLWSNWDVLYAIARGPIRAARVGPGPEPIWDGKGFGGYGEWHLYATRASIDHGTFEYSTKGRFFRRGLSGVSTLEYRRTSDDKLAYSGSAVIHNDDVSAPLRWILGILCDRASSYISRMGGRVAEEITLHPDVVLRAAGPHAHNLYQEYMAEEAAIRRGGRGPFKHFFVDSYEPVDGLEALRKRVEHLEETIRRLGAPAVPWNVSEYSAAIRIFGDDPQMALLKNRTIIHHILQYIVAREGGTVQRDQTAALQMIEWLRHNVRRIPQNVFVLMGTVNALADAALMDEPNVTIDLTEFGASFSATLKVAEWFFSSYLGGAPLVKEVGSL
ncbi:MAG TPA: hypothetical protein VI670_21585 [Thermoanaerobaculia bacterium]